MNLKKKNPAVDFLIWIKIIMFLTRVAGITEACACSFDFSQENSQI